MGRRKKRETPAMCPGSQTSNVVCTSGFGFGECGAMGTWGSTCRQGNHQPALGRYSPAALLTCSPDRRHFPFCSSGLAPPKCQLKLPTGTSYHAPWGQCHSKVLPVWTWMRPPQHAKALFCSIHSSSSPEQRQFHIILNDHVQNNKGRLRAQMH